MLSYLTLKTSETRCWQGKLLKHVRHLINMSTQQEKLATMFDGVIICRRLIIFMALLPARHKCGLRMRLECRERFPRRRRHMKPLVNDSSMHHGTCVTHVPWCMLGSLIRGSGKNVPGIRGACAIRNFAYLVSGPWRWPNIRSQLNKCHTYWSRVRLRYQHISSHGNNYVDCPVFAFLEGGFHQRVMDYISGTKQNAKTFYFPSRHPNINRYISYSDIS